VKGPVFTLGGGPVLPLHGLPAPPDLDRLLPGEGGWVVEIGYGKGRYLGQQALGNPGRRYLGIEIVSKYWRMLGERAARRGAANLLNVRGEALSILATALPRGFAAEVHVYFPDPWPKSRHHRRRLFDPETVDLLLAALEPRGRLLFATDFLEYGGLVRAILEGHPELEVTVLEGEWPDGARTNYEAKFIREGRPILRLAAGLKEDASQGRIHPAGEPRLANAWAPHRDD
jgi:tRNA (guanine-N7-)-methyltransferase